MGTRESTTNYCKMSSPKKTGLQAELNVSADLAAIIGTKKGEKISRPQVTKRLWAYLKEHNLQDSENRQYFTPDETMAKVFGSEKIKCFSMSKSLTDPLTKSISRANTRPFTLS